MRIVKWVFGGLAAIVVILGLVWVMLPKDRIINFALNQIEGQTGRDISVGGDAELKIFPNLVVVADQVSVANADWSDRGAMMSADRLDVSVSMAALLGGDIVISRLSLIRPDILLERNENGQANWVFGSDQPQKCDAPQTDDEADQTAGTDGADVPLIEIPIAEIVDGQVRYSDRVTGQDITVRDISAELRLPSLDQPVTFCRGAELWRAAPYFGGQCTVARGFWDDHTHPIWGRGYSVRRRCIVDQWDRDHDGQCHGRFGSGPVKHAEFPIRV